MAVDPVGEEVVGPAGPTTATRMDKFTRMMLEQGLLAMVGKAERGPAAVEAIRDHQSAYLMAVGGAARLLQRGQRRGGATGGGLSGYVTVGGLGIATIGIGGVFVPQDRDGCFRPLGEEN